MRLYASPNERACVGPSSATGAAADGVAAAATGAPNAPWPSKPDETTRTEKTSARHNFNVFTALRSNAVIPVHSAGKERTRLRTGRTRTKLKRGRLLARARLFSAAGSRRDDPDGSLRRHRLGLPASGDQRAGGDDLQRASAPRGALGRRRA